jgi:ABC-type phosphate/phosphonate transport system substrate-binding protein
LSNRALHRFWLVLVLLVFGLGVVRGEAPPPVAIGFHLPVIRDLPRKDVEVSLRFWTEELAQSVNLTYMPIRFYDDLDELKRDMNAGTINYLVATSMGVAQHFSPEELSDGFSGYKTAPDHLLLVVRRAAEIRRIADLAGKRVAVLDQDELSEVYLETLLMKVWGKSAESRLAAISREKRSSNLVHRLFFNQTDAALINRNAYEAAVALNPQIGERLQVLEEYSFKSRSPHIGLFSARVAPEHREIIAQAAMKLNESARGRQVLEIYQADALVVTRVRELLPFRELLEAHRSLKAAGAVPARKVAR